MPSPALHEVVDASSAPECWVFYAHGQVCGKNFPGRGGRFPEALPPQWHPGARKR